MTGIWIMAAIWAKMHVADFKLVTPIWVMAAIWAMMHVTDLSPAQKTE